MRADSFPNNPQTEANNHISSLQVAEIVERDKPAYIAPNEDIKMSAFERS